MTPDFISNSMGMNMSELVFQGLMGRNPQRVHVGIWSILRAQGGSHIPTLRPKYIPYSYMDPLGPKLKKTRAATIVAASPLPTEAHQTVQDLAPDPTCPTSNSLKSRL